MEIRLVKEIDISESSVTFSEEFTNNVISPQFQTFFNVCQASRITFDIVYLNDYENEFLVNLIKETFFNDAHKVGNRYCVLPRELNTFFFFELPMIEKDMILKSEHFLYEPHREAMNCIIHYLNHRYCDMVDRVTPRLNGKKPRDYFTYYFEEVN